MCVFDDRWSGGDGDGFRCRCFIRVLTFFDSFSLVFTFSAFVIVIRLLWLFITVWDLLTKLPVSNFGMLSWPALQIHRIIVTFIFLTFTNTKFESRCATVIYVCYLPGLAVKNAVTISTISGLVVNCIIKDNLN